MKEKEVFDWLREQLEENQTIVFNLGGKRPIQSIDYEKVIELVNEAEKKLDEQVCEWERAEWNPKHVIASPHEGCMPLNIVDLEKHPFCGHCRKRIRIKEGKR